MKNRDSWLTVREAATAAGVHPNTVRAWLRGGRVRAVLHDDRHGPTYRIPPEDVPRPRELLRGYAAVEQPLHELVERLARVEDARLEEARARAKAEARLEELEDLRRELEEARAEISALRTALARRLADV